MPTSDELADAQCTHGAWHWEQGLLAWLKVCDSCETAFGIGGKAYGRYRTGQIGENDGD